LIENFEGKFPLWLAPVQVVVMTITDAQREYAQKVVKRLKKEGIRVISDLRNEKIGFKIREHTLGRVPFLLVAGDRELENEHIAVRSREGKDLGAMPVEAFIQHLEEVGLKLQT
jgi:threonyl-tRNA synthetase